MADVSGSDTTYFDNPKFSDLTIRLSNDRHVHAHRVILSRGSEYFRKMLGGDFSESAARDIKLKDDDLDALMEVLRTIYGIKYASAEPCLASPWTYHASVYIVAEKYGLDTLKQEVNDAFASLAFPGTEVRGDTAASSDDCATQYSDLFEAMQVIFSGTLEADDPARLLLVRRCFSRTPQLLKMDDFKALLRELPDIAIVLLERQAVAFYHGNIDQQIEATMGESTGWTTYKVTGSVTDTPNDFIEAMRERTSLRETKQETVDVKLLETTPWEPREWVAVNRSEFDTTFAESLVNKNDDEEYEDTLRVRDRRLRIYVL